MERWEERARARARLRKAAARLPWPVDVVIHDAAIVLYVPAGGGLDAAKLLGELGLSVRVELRERAVPMDEPPARAA